MADSDRVGVVCQYPQSLRPFPGGEVADRPDEGVPRMRNRKILHGPAGPVCEIQIEIPHPTDMICQVTFIDSTFTRSLAPFGPSCGHGL